MFSLYDKRKKYVFSNERTNNTINIRDCRQETEVSILREAVWLRDESASPHTAASPGYQGAVSVLLADVHAEQHRQTAHRTGAQGRTESEGLSTNKPLDVRHGAAVTASSLSSSSSSSSSSSLSSWLSLSSSRWHRRQPCGYSSYLRVARNGNTTNAGTRKKQRGWRSVHLFPRPTSVNAIPIPCSIRVTLGTKHFLREIATLRLTALRRKLTDALTARSTKELSRCVSSRRF